MKMATDRRHRSAPRPLDNERGLALVIVLAVVALLTILVTEFTFNTQLDQHRTRNAIHAMQAQLLARSGINLAEGFLMLDEEPAFDAYTEDWFPQMVEFCKGIEVDPTMRIRCTVRDESGKLNINNTREPRRKVESQAVTASAVLRDAMRCMFERRGIDVEVVDKLADYWQRCRPTGRHGGGDPRLHLAGGLRRHFPHPSRICTLRAVMTAQPRSPAPHQRQYRAAEVLAGVLNAEQEAARRATRSARSSSASAIPISPSRQRRPHPLLQGGQPQHQDRVVRRPEQALPAGGQCADQRRPRRPQQRWHRADGQQPGGPEHVAQTQSQQQQRSAGGGQRQAAPQLDFAATRLAKGGGRAPLPSAARRG
jgi:hypothetical protein